VADPWDVSSSGDYAGLRHAKRFEKLLQEHFAGVSRRAMGRQHGDSSVADEEHLWAERYDRNVRDVVAIQNEIVAAIAREGHVHLLPEERQLPREAVERGDGEALHHR
jgi:hypothetical protein